MPLTALSAKNAKPQDRAYKLTDEKGMFLQITPTGAKYWRLKYRFGGKEKLLALGVYPEVSLQDARERRDAARRMLAEDPPRDPGAVKQKAKAQKAQDESLRSLEASGAPIPGTFEYVAREWVHGVHRAKVSAGHADRTLVRFEKDAFPWIGRRPLAEITPPELLQVIRRVEDRGAIETAHRLKDAAGQVFRYGIAAGICGRNPAADLRDALKPVQVKHHAAIIDPKELGKLLRDIDGYAGQPVTVAALKLSALLLLRPGELRRMRPANPS